LRQLFKESRFEIFSLCKRGQNPLRLEQSPVEPFATPAQIYPNTTKKRRRKSLSFVYKNKTADKIGGFFIFSLKHLQKIR
jgi:hypothetical protein